MSSYKDTHLSRPASQHRLSSSATPSSHLSNRNTSSRNHGHSLSLGALNPSHRVTRRKSMTSTVATNVAAMAAAMNGAGEEAFDVAIPPNRRSMTSTRTSSYKAAESTVVAGSAAATDFSSSLGSGSATRKHQHMSSVGKYADSHNSAIADDLPSSLLENNAASTKGRGRRASEGAHLITGEGKRTNGAELRCNKCGKGYKHSSCLTKHLWEHTPEWSYTSKLLISKHQQVQLLEAASVLVTMNQDGPTPPEVGRNVDSDHSSASPAASGYSDVQEDEISSVETTPPPLNEEQISAHATTFTRSYLKRYSSNSSAYSRSYQSAPSGSVFAGSAPSGSSGIGHYRQQSSEQWPSVPGIGLATSALDDEDEAGLVAAVNSLCSFGTPRMGPVHLPPDVPPVPPLPAKFLGQSAQGLSLDASTPTFQHAFGIAPLTHQLSEERNVRMERPKIAHSEDSDTSRRTILRSRSDEDDDGIFGKMEE